MKEINTNTGQIVLVDDDDFQELSKRTWVVAKRSNLGVYARAMIDGKWKYMHRLIMGSKSGEIVDHKNMNGLDNRRDNLRLCGMSENSSNRVKKAGVNVSSKYKGVHFDRRNKKSENRWIAMIYAGGRSKYLGLFATEVEAAEAYNRAASTAFGEFARLNDIPLAIDIPRAIKDGPHAHEISRHHFREKINAEK